MPVITTCRTTVIVAATALALLLGATACSVEIPLPEQSGPSVTPPSPSPTDELMTEIMEQAPAAETPPESGGLLAPGQSTTSAGSVPFVNYDGQEAVFSHRVTSIESMSSADRDTLVAEQPQLGDYDLYLVNIESSYVSGANLEFNSFGTNFDPVDASLAEMQSIALIGYDFCETNSIPSPGNDPSMIIKNCVVAAAPSGTPGPAGVGWSAFDTPYDKYDSAPAYFLNG